MKNWVKYRIRKFDSVIGTTSEVEKLRNEIQFAKSELDKKVAIIMEQLKTMMDLAKQIKQ